MPAVAGNGLHHSDYVTFLVCRHEVTYSCGEPTAGDLVWCHKCYDYRAVRHIAGKYGVNCSDCRYARNYGGEVSALTKAAAHAFRHLGHSVTVHGPEGFHHEVCIEPQQIMFDDCGEEIPPF